MKNQKIKINDGCRVIEVLRFDKGLMKWDTSPFIVAETKKLNKAIKVLRSIIKEVFPKDLSDLEIIIEEKHKERN